MGSLHQGAALDCYPGVCDQGQLLKIEIQFPLNNFNFALAYSHQTCCMGSLHQDTAWDCYPCVCNQGQGHCLKK